MPQQSAGLLMYRTLHDELEFFLVHPGGPFWSKKDEGAWSIPKGLTESTEELLDAAKREFKEETGIEPIEPFHTLGSVKLKSGKIIHAWAFAGAWDPAQGITSNHIQIEWPPRSRKFISIPEADKGAWMSVEKASIMINAGQLPLLARAQQLLNT
jgi:predicted NUDIX family NTP pyrophosphohydrolase